MCACSLRRVARCPPVRRQRATLRGLLSRWCGWRYSGLGGVQQPQNAMKREDRLRPSLLVNTIVQLTLNKDESVGRMKEEGGVVFVRATSATLVAETVGFKYPALAAAEAIRDIPELQGREFTSPPTRLRPCRAVEFVEKPRRGSRWASAETANTSPQYGQRPHLLA